MWWSSYMRIWWWIMMTCCKEIKWRCYRCRTDGHGKNRTSRIFFAYSRRCRDGYKYNSWGSKCPMSIIQYLELLLSLLTEHELDESCLHCKRKTGPECDRKSGSNFFAKKVFFNFLRSGSDCSLPCTHRAPFLYPVASWSWDAGGSARFANRTLLVSCPRWRCKM